MTISLLYGGTSPLLRMHLRERSKEVTEVTKVKVKGGEGEKHLYIIGFNYGIEYWWHEEDNPEEIKELDQFIKDTFPNLKVKEYKVDHEVYEVLKRVFTTTKGKYIICVYPDIEHYKKMEEGKRKQNNQP